jgi:hypothetical protein
VVSEVLEWGIGRCLEAKGRGGEPLGVCDEDMAVRVVVIVAVVVVVAGLCYI